MTIQRHDSGPRMSKAVVHGDTVYLAGIVADAPKGKSMGEQTKSILSQIDGFLAKAGTVGMPVSMEEKLRGADGKIAGALIVDTLYENDAEAVGAQLAKQFPDADIGVFRVLCHIGRSDL
jgi:hypothetical protein